MSETLFPIFALGLLGFGFLTTSLCLAIMLGPKKRTAVKNEPFECGTVGVGEAGGRFGVKFYLVALVFILFDVEIVFLFPWATQVVALGWPAFWGALGFLLVLGLGLLYVIQRGVLDWNQ